MGTEQQSYEIEDLAFELYREQMLERKYGNQMKYFLGVEDE